MTLDIQWRFFRHLANLESPMLPGFLVFGFVAQLKRKLLYVEAG
jgi:hypothetical protein